MAALAETLKICRLTPADAAQAFPLVQSVHPNATLETWVEYVTDMSAQPATEKPSAGILVARTRRGYIHGLLSYRIARDPVHRRCLEVDLFVAFEMGSRSEVTSALLTIIEALSERTGCGAVHIAVPKRWNDGRAAPQGVVSRLESAGHLPEKISHCKVLMPKASSAPLTDQVGAASAP